MSSLKSLLTFGLCGVAACGAAMPVPEQVASAAFVPAPRQAAQAWAAATQSDGNHLLRFKWQYLNERSAVRGTGSLRIAAGDSLRLDFRGPLGSARGAAAVVGTALLWAVPEEEVDKFVPNYVLLWAMMGVALAPATGDTVLTAEDARLTAYRYVAGADTVDYYRTRTSSQFVADVRRAGTRVGRVITVLDAAGKPTRSRLEVPSGPARLDITFTEWTIPGSHPAGTWNAPVSDQ